MPTSNTIRAAALTALCFGAAPASACLVANIEGVPPIIPGVIAAAVLASVESAMEVLCNDWSVQLVDPRT